MLKVGNGNCNESLAFEILPSFLPLGTSQLGPPDYYKFKLEKYSTLISAPIHTFANSVTYASICYVAKLISEIK